MVTPRASRVVVIGADAAGMSAAHQAVRRAKSSARPMEVIALEATQFTSYSACGIPYWVAGDVNDPDRLVARHADEHRRMGVDLRLGMCAEGVDLQRQLVHGRDVASGQPTTFPFDELVLATGAKPIVPGWARGVDGRTVRGVLPVKTLMDGEAWLDALCVGTRSNGCGGMPTNGVVVGGGYIGLEIAEAMVRRGVRTTLVTRHEVMTGLDPDMGARVRLGLQAGGVDVITDTRVEGLQTDAVGCVVGVTAQGRDIAADVVALGVGVQPATSLGADAGIRVGDARGYLPDDRQSVAERVWAAGDCCESVDRVCNTRVLAPLGTHANKQGRVAGENLAGGRARFAGVLGTAITRFVAGGVHVEVARTGPTQAQAEAAGWDVVTLVTEGRTASGYMPEAHPMATKVLADRTTRRLLGMQIVGGPGSGKRIDTAAAALWSSQTVDDVAGMDLSYAPPFATVWDAIQLACRRLSDRI